ncbi:MAG: class II aldolase/adducin family protein [Gammaproteobacteria bacterium]|nr:class II aldolase/adducin family protein [Gammaproteobacteria bacterium]
MDIKQDLIRHYHWLRQYGYNDSHSGNASVRDGDQFWVTPTGACADLLEAKNLVACSCSVNGELGEGASLDAKLHALVYQKNPTANAILHSHGAYSVAMTMQGEDFMPQDFEGQYYFDRIPVISIPYDQYLELAADAISDALASHKVAVVRGHGVYAAAESINLAYKWTCSFELSAKTCFIAQQAGTL